MQGFLISLLALAFASFLCIFGIGAIAFRKDFLAAYQEWKKSSSTAAAQEASTFILVTSETGSPARIFLSATDSVRTKVADTAIYSQPFTLQRPQIFVPQEKSLVDFFAEGTSSFFPMRNTRTTAIGAM